MRAAFGKKIQSERPFFVKLRAPPRDECCYYWDWRTFTVAED